MRVCNALEGAQYGELEELGYVILNKTNLWSD